MCKGVGIINYCNYISKYIIILYFKFFILCKIKCFWIKFYLINKIKK